MTTITALRTTVNLGTFSFDAYELPDGEKRIGFSGAANVFGYENSWLGRVNKNIPLPLKELGYTGAVKEVELRTPENKTTIKTISIQDFCCLINHECNKGNYKALELKGIKAVKQPQKKMTEKAVQHVLADRVNGICEVICPAGKIDILTLLEIIEVKKVDVWKSALGQILVYGHYYPSHQKRIHLIGVAHSATKEMIELHCAKFNVLVTWD